MPQVGRGRVDLRQRRRDAQYRLGTRATALPECTGRNDHPHPRPEHAKDPGPTTIGVWIVFGGWGTLSQKEGSSTEFVGPSRHKDDFAPQNQGLGRHPFGSRQAKDLGRFDQKKAGPFDNARAPGYRYVVSRSFERMIRRRFSIFRGVGGKKEREIWQAGVADWSRLPGRRAGPRPHPGQVHRHCRTNPALAHGPGSRRPPVLRRPTGCAGTLEPVRGLRQRRPIS